ncbi:hypothetical protein CKM354_000833300 [Cercospora kikuchii]|uniref:Uncharacterized protein n=1 Tax=Cercospora kikuchii TaxID=84275 RepID=A0A9P3FIB4_9PEZI|nr:uncharacterized protein CKM354_000833300 [Cercospora kikuchii]GIZ45152.1 hypothetical protein CKM354_000833300 [Cercospora kikuchii]
MRSTLNRRITRGAGLRNGPFDRPDRIVRRVWGDERDLPRACRRITEGEYNVSGRRAPRIHDQSKDLYHNKYYRGRFTSGTVVGWYTHDQDEWENRKVKTLLRRKLTLRTHHLSKETKARYLKLKQGYISTDSILTEIEQNQIRTSYANALAAAQYSHEDEYKERRALWRQQKQQEREEAEKARLQAILKALGGRKRAAAPEPASASAPEDVSKVDSGRATPAKSQQNAPGQTEFEKTLGGIAK